MTAYISPWGKIRRMPAKLTRLAATLGWTSVPGWCAYQLGWRLREWRLGIDTREFAHGVVVEDSGPCHGYEPIDHRCFDSILDHLAARPDRDVFVDYGCGMGRAVVLAARRGFRRVIGVERDARLAGIARQNVAQAATRGKLACGHVEIVETDAAGWTVPDDVTCIFLFNSFGGELLERVLNRIQQSLQRNWRTLCVVYVHPRSSPNLVEGTPWLAERCDLPTGFWTHVRTVVYETRQESFAAEPADLAARQN